MDSVLSGKAGLLYVSTTIVSLGAGLLASETSVGWGVLLIGLGLIGLGYREYLKTTKKASKCSYKEEKTK